MQFNPDGSLKVAKKTPRDHLVVFRLINELDFPVGKKLLAQILRGEENAKTLKLNLHKKINHGALGGYDEEDLIKFIDYLLRKGLLTIHQQNGKYPVLVLTKDGEKELEDRQLSMRVDDILSGEILTDNHFTKSYQAAAITDKERELFTQLDFFLEGFTDEQKKAVVCLDKKQVCIAGAGSGKTRVLTHKIVYLIKFAGVKPEDILAVTFTRKAKEEMQNRLAQLLPDTAVRVETFNSFAEKELLKHGKVFYGQERGMVNNRDFIRFVLQGLEHLGFEQEEFLNTYFLPRERRGKEPRQLFFSFLYDFRAIMDTFIMHGKDESFFDQKFLHEQISVKSMANSLLRLVSYVHNQLEEHSLRTYADQLVDIVELCKTKPELKKSFQWVLVDEYQDVNDIQVELLNEIAPENLFVVGDPRQSIYAWRGANPHMMFSFIDDGATVIELTTNFRSTQPIVTLANAVISQTNKGNHTFTPLHATNGGGEGEDVQDVKLVSFGKEDEEATFILHAIKNASVPRKEIFVLSRTNKGLERIAQLCEEEQIKFLLRTDERQEADKEPDPDQITLSTVHAIKGLEADMVFVMGANIGNYPCKAKDHRFVELLASPNEYDQYEEERRILYVAVTRAKKLLVMSYVGAPTSFLSRAVLTASGIDSGIGRAKSNSAVSADEQRANLRRWRFLESKERNIPPYMIFNDRVLEQLISLQPHSVDDLYNLKSFGRNKIEEFGEDIVAILHRV